MNFRSIVLWSLACCFCCSKAVALDPVPQTAQELYDSFDPKGEPLDVQVIREWDEEGVHVKFVTYHLGAFEGQNGKTHRPRIAAYYAYPASETKLPAIVDIHGGGGVGKPENAIYWAQQGYACISISWSTAKLKHEKEGSPNTDWDGLAVGHGRGITPQFNTTTQPTEHTLSSVPSPKNCGYYLVTCAARRALTFLEEQPQVDANRLGISGHSMGGMTTVYASMDPRVKAAVPSVGGVDLLEDYWGVPGSNKQRDRWAPELFSKVVAAINYWPLIKCPVLFLTAANDFHAPSDKIPETLAKHSGIHALSISPHRSHSFDGDSYAARPLWMEAHLKGTFKFPENPKGQLILDTEDGVPVFRVLPDKPSDKKISRVDIFYGYDRDPLVRFWADGKAENKGEYWEGRCPIFDLEEPLFVFANVIYEVETDISLSQEQGGKKISQLSISSDYVTTYPDQLKSSGVKPTEKWSRMIYDGSDMSEWAVDKGSLMTRKLVDPRWYGPKDGKLFAKVKTTKPSRRLKIRIETSQKRSQVVPRDQRLPAETYYAVSSLKEPGTHEVELSSVMFKTDEGKALEDWTTAIETLTLYVDDTIILEELSWKGGTEIQRSKPFEVNLKKEKDQSISSSE